MKNKLKAGHTRWFAMAGKSHLRGTVVTLQIISRKGDRIAVRFLGFPDLIYSEKTILENTFPTYRKAQQYVNQRFQSNSLPS